MRISELKDGDGLVAQAGVPGWTAGQAGTVRRVKRGAVLVPGPAEDGSDDIVAEWDAIVVDGGTFGPRVLGVRSDGGIGRYWVRPGLRHRPDSRLAEADLELTGFAPARAAEPAVRRKGRE
jgi:hypothetical protein